MPWIPKSWANSGYIKLLITCSLILFWKHSLISSFVPFSQPGKIGALSITAKGTSISSSTSTTFISSILEIGPVVLVTLPITSNWLVSLLSIKVSLTSAILSATLIAPAFIAIWGADVNIFFIDLLEISS